MSRLLKIIGLFCRIQVSFVGLFCKREILTQPTSCQEQLENSQHIQLNSYGVAMISKLLKMISFAQEPYKRDLYSAKETYNLKEPTNRSHPISKELTTHPAKQLWGGYEQQAPSNYRSLLQKVGLFCRALLQTRPVILSSLLFVATPQQHIQLPSQLVARNG